ncbi:MAG: cytochrome c-type biogenesis protein [Acidimicrobiales bacterium]
MSERGRTIAWLRLAGWAVMAVVLFGALAVANRHPHVFTSAQRSHRLATEIRCPECRELSAADSDAPAARAVRDEIARRVQAGQSDGEIRGFLVSRYGKDILLRPPATGVGGLVWALPVAALVGALAGLTLAFRRWRRRPATRAAVVSEEDRARVARALGGR